MVVCVNIKRSTRLLAIWACFVSGRQSTSENFLVIIRPFRLVNLYVKRFCICRRQERTSNDFLIPTEFSQTINSLASPKLRNMCPLVLLICASVLYDCTQGSFNPILRYHETLPFGEDYRFLLPFRIWPDFSYQNKCQDTIVELANGMVLSTNNHRRKSDYLFARTAIENLDDSPFMSLECIFFYF